MEKGITKDLIKLTIVHSTDIGKIIKVSETRYETDYDKYMNKCPLTVEYTGYVVHVWTNNDHTATNVTGWFDTLVEARRFLGVDCTPKLKLAA